MATPGSPSASSSSTSSFVKLPQLTPATPPSSPGRPSPRQQHRARAGSAHSGLLDHRGADRGSDRGGLERESRQGSGKVRSNSSSGLTSAAASPTLARRLKAIEAWLAKELQTRGFPAKGPSDQRLEVHREALRRFTETFKSYQPLLTAISREYDLRVEELRAERHKLHESTKQLAVYQQDHALRLSSERAQAIAEADDLRAQCRQLRAAAAATEETRLSLQTQVDMLAKQLRQA